MVFYKNLSIPYKDLSTFIELKYLLKIFIKILISRSNLFNFYVFLLSIDLCNRSTRSLRTQSVRPPRTFLLRSYDHIDGKQYNSLALCEVIVAASCTLIPKISPIASNVYTLIAGVLILPRYGIGVK